MLTRTAAAAGAAVVLALMGAIPAAANGWGTVDCSQSPTPNCQLSTGTGGNQGGGAGRGNHDPGYRAPGRVGGGARAGTGNGGDTILGGTSNLAHCSYAPSDYQPPAGAVTAADRIPPSLGGPTGYLVAFTHPIARATPTSPEANPATGGQGAWYVWKCTSAGVADGLYHPPVFLALGPPGPGAAPLPSAVQLAQLARNQLRLPMPTIAANPAGEQLVNLPTWLWLSHGWTPVAATASVPGVSVTAVAHPSSVTWSMGDGATVTCTATGPAFPAGGDPRTGSPTCGHTYRTSSAHQARQAFPVSATVHWSVTWSGAGQAGVFPDMTTSGAAALRVAEAQALNTSG